VAIKVTRALTEISRGFPSAYKVLTIAGVVFLLFNFLSWLLAADPVYESWLRVSGSITDVMEKLVPGVNRATSFLDQHRAILGQRQILYWIPAIRNVLSIDFALVLFFSLFFSAALFLDLLADPKRARDSINRAHNGDLGGDIEDLLLRGLALVSLFFLPLYFGMVGTVNPYLISLSMNIVYYTTVLGIDGLFICLTIFLLLCDLRTNWRDEGKPIKS
jgi:hypothetical protein